MKERSNLKLLAAPKQMECYCKFMENIIDVIPVDVGEKESEAAEDEGVETEVEKSEGESVSFAEKRSYIKNTSRERTFTSWNSAIRGDDNVEYGSLLRSNF